MTEAERMPWTYQKDIHDTAHDFYKWNEFKFKAAITNPQWLCDCLNEYIPLRAENSRLQQQLASYSNALTKEHQTSKAIYNELKAAQEMNRELVEALSEWVEVAKRKYPPKDPTGIALLKHYESIIKKSAPFKSAQK